MAMVLKQPPPPGWDLEHLLAAIEAAGVAMWSWNVETDRIVMDDRAHALWGVSQDEEVTFEVLSARIHPQDLDRVRAAFSATRAILGAYETDFRILTGDKVRWISARGKGHDAGIVKATMAGIFLDVTQRKQAEEAHELIAGEMSHRVKNLLAIASRLTEITSRSVTTAAEMARELSHRLTALGRAHDLVQPTVGHGDRRQGRALLGDMLTILLAPYDDMEASGGRVRVSVPRVGISESVATMLAMVVHELATNSLKHGALSAVNGTLDVSCSLHDKDAVIVWIERGGAPVTAPTNPTGYGMSLIRRSISRQFDGSIDFDWSKEGLIATLRVRKDHFLA